MAYLLAKYTLLFLLTALLGFLLGRWWTRRSFVDVTESYESLSKAAASNDDMWNSLWQRLDGLDDNIGPSVRKELGAIPKVDAPVLDLSKVEGRLDEISKRVDAIRIPEPPETDLSEVVAKLDAVESGVGAINIPEAQMPDLEPTNERIAALAEAIRSMPKPTEQTPVDLGPVTGRLDKLHNTLANLPKPEEQTPVDLEPLTGRLDDVQNTLANLPKPEPQKPVSFDAVNDRLAKLERAVSEIPGPEKQAVVDLQPLEQRLSEIGRTIHQLPKVETHPPVDLRPLSSRLTEMDERIAGIKMPEAVDIGPLDRRLTAIELTLKDLRFTGRAAPARKEQARKASVRKTKGPRLFKSPVQGKKDDLKRISGVGPKLERVLNRNGVFYFWQVSEWSAKDVEFIDARLDVFKGRIDRDDWVSQAKKLKRDSGSATAPG